MWHIEQKVQTLGFAVYTANTSSVKLHSHSHLELAYVESGEMEHTIHGEKRILRAGNFFIVDHGISHSYRRVSKEVLVVRNLLFYPEFLDRGLTGSSRFQDVMSSYLLHFCYQTLKHDPTGITLQDQDSAVLNLINTIEKEYHAENYGYLEYIRCTLVEVLILVARIIGRHTAGSSQSEIVRQMVKYADAHYCEPIKLNKIAAELGYCAPYLSQKFSREMGMSFTDYLHSLRIRRGCHLLETTSMNVAQIAEAVGYDGAKYFTQMFKKQLSITPGKFRAMHT